ncbi:hypothetical protein IMPERIA75_200092 [Imperialibacter sp. 75]|nr:hypothetical protein IMPERIA75_200092 [Imperialibacter sp. 75]
MCEDTHENGFGRKNGLLAAKVLPASNKPNNYLIESPL